MAAAAAVGVAPEYEAVFDDIDRLTVGSSDVRADAYAKLVKREARVLRTVDRVVNSARHKTIDDESFVHLSLSEIAMRTLRKLQLIIDDLLHIKRPHDVVDVLWKGDRKIYVGLLLMLTSFLVFFATASS